MPSKAFRTHSEAFGTPSEPFRTLAESLGMHSEAFGTRSESFGTHAESFGTPPETFGTRSESFGMSPGGLRRSGEHSPPFQGVLITVEMCSSGRKERSAGTKEHSSRT